MPSRPHPLVDQGSKLPLGSDGELFRLVVEAAPNAILVTDSSGRIELVNQQAEKLFRYSRDELLGKQVEILIPQRFRHHHPSLRGMFMADPTTRAMGAGRDLFACTRDGEEIPIEIGLNPIHTPEGTRVLSSIIDIRERKAAEERFREQTEQIAAASRYKSEFLANMSHELRTPLNSILLLSEQLKNNPLGNLTQKQVTHADIIHRSGSDLLTLINDILDLSKIEAGRMTVMMETISLKEFAESIERSFRPMAEARQLHFSVTAEVGAPPFFSSDHQRIFQIVRNLLSNALKFTSEGGIGIRLFGEGSGVGSRIGMAVSDTGIGIPEDKQEVIFDAFRQLDGSTSRRFGGTGLGLSISRSLAQLLGGDIRLDSQPGQGSTFTLFLPVGPVDAPGVPSRQDEVPSSVSDLLVEDKPGEARLYAGLFCEPGDPLALADGAPAAAELASGQPLFSGKRLLLVDDDVRNIYAMSSLLEDLGFEVEVAMNGQQALDAVDSLAPLDLILMDMMMPVLDGYQAIRELKQRPHPTPPVIAVTAHAMRGDREKCLEAGADDYLAKPVAQDDLIRLLQIWLEPEQG